MRKNTIFWVCLVHYCEAFTFWFDFWSKVRKSLKQKCLGLIWKQRYEKEMICLGSLSWSVYVSCTFMKILTFLYILTHLSRDNLRVEYWVIGKKWRSQLHYKMIGKKCQLQLISDWQKVKCPTMLLSDWRKLKWPTTHFCDWQKIGSWL